MTKNFSYIITVQDDKGRIEKLPIECYLIPPQQNESYYGNGHYGAIYLGNQLLIYLDLRYQSIKSPDIIFANSLQEYFGKNLLSMKTRPV